MFSFHSRSIRNSSFALAASFGMLAFAYSDTALADEPNPADVMAARKLGLDGVRLAEEDRCDEAIVLLDRSEKLFHAPTTLQKLGECRIKTGKIVAGLEALRKVAREPIDPARSPAAFVTARDRAKQLIEENEGKVGNVRITVKAPKECTIEAKIDGDVLSEASFGLDRPVDPGEHKVLVEGQGCFSKTESFTATVGATKELTITLEIDPNAPKPLPKNANFGPNGQLRAPESRFPILPWAITGGLAITTGVFGALTLVARGNQRDVQAEPASKTDLESAANRVKTFALIADIAGAATLVAGGVSLFLTLRKPATEKAQNTNVWVGLGSAGFAHRF